MTIARWMAPALALFALTTVAGPGLAADPAKTDDPFKQFEGTWTSSSAGESEVITWVFKGETVDVDSADRDYKAKLILAPGKDKPSVDFKVTEGPEDTKGQTIKGIYEFAGEKLRLCVAAKEGPRPEEFKGEEGKAYLFELTKKKK